MRNINFTTGEYYHVFNHGVDDRLIFKVSSDYRQFYQMMYLFNDVNYENRRGDKDHNVFLLASSEIDIKEPLVRILSFCLISDHFHMFVEQLVDDGISKFMHKLQFSYSTRFNKLNDRRGTLFEDTFEAKHVDTESYFQHIIRYIHLNALDTKMPEWRQGKVRDWSQALQILDSYEWSSHHAYMDKEQLLPVIDQISVKQSFGSVDSYINFLRDWSQD